VRRVVVAKVRQEIGRGSRASRGLGSRGGILGFQLGWRSDLEMRSNRMMLRFEMLGEKSRWTLWRSAWRNLRHPGSPSGMCLKLQASTTILPSTRAYL
jgi:hypothetical protein